MSLILLLPWFFFSCYCFAQQEKKTPHWSHFVNAIFDDDDGEDDDDDDDDDKHYT